MLLLMCSESISVAHASVLLTLHHYQYVYCTTCRTYIAHTHAHTHTLCIGQNQIHRIGQKHIYTLYTVFSAWKPPKIRC